MFDRSGRLNRRGSSSRELLDGIEIPADSSKLRAGSDAQPAWAAITRSHLWDYFLLLVLAFITVACETATPFSKVIYMTSDQEYWKYSYPLHIHNTVPSWSVPVIATLVPLSVILLLLPVAKPSRVETHNLILGLFSSVFLTATVTNLVKIGVGRPRPNFVARCWPDGGVMRFTPAGLPDCAENAINPNEGRKSFPSGHTAWSTSGLAYLTFWLAGWLRCFDGRGHPMRLALAGLPISCAAWIGITRLQDYWHHWEDVLAGFLLGLTFAYLCYRQHYPPLMSARAGEALASAGDTSGEAQRQFPDLEAALGQDL